jgi:hypothetical protein
MLSKAAQVRHERKEKGEEKEERRSDSTPGLACAFGPSPARSVACSGLPAPPPLQEAPKPPPAQFGLHSSCNGQCLRECLREKEKTCLRECLRECVRPAPAAHLRSSGCLPNGSAAWTHWTPSGGRWGRGSGGPCAAQPCGEDGCAGLSRCGFRCGCGCSVRDCPFPRCLPSAAPALPSPAPRLVTLAATQAATARQIATSSVWTLPSPAPRLVTLAVTQAATARQIATSSVWTLPSPAPRLVTLAVTQAATASGSRPICWDHSVESHIAAPNRHVPSPGKLCACGPNGC